MRLIDADALKQECMYIDDIPAVTERDIHNAPTIHSIPVEWLESQIRPYTGDVSDIGKSSRNGTIKNLIREWQKEQEAR